MFTVDTDDEIYDGGAKSKTITSSLTENKDYKKIIADTKQNLEDSIPKINTAFETCDFGCLLTELEDYDKNVKKHYKEFLRATEVWDELKIKMIEDERYN